VKSGATRGAPFVRHDSRGAGDGGDTASCLASRVFIRHAIIEPVGLTLDEKRKGGIIDAGDCVRHGQSCARPLRGGDEIKRFLSRGRIRRNVPLAVFARLSQHGE